jgi:L-iditol 2-dehydrogenase
MSSFQEVAKHTGAKISKPMIGKPVMVGGADRVFECVGSEPSMRNALNMTRSGGQVIVVSVPNSLKVDWTPISVKELTISSSWAYHHAEEFEGKKQTTFEIALHLLNDSKVDLEWMVTHVFTLREYKKAFEMLTRRKNHEVIKAAFGFD